MVCMVSELRSDDETEFAAIRSVVSRLGIGSAETVCAWVRQVRVDAGTWPGVGAEESEQLRELRWENAELRRADEILKGAPVFFVAVLERPSRSS